MFVGRGGREGAGGEGKGGRERLRENGGKAVRGKKREREKSLIF